VEEMCSRNSSYRWPRKRLYPQEGRRSHLLRSELEPLDLVAVKGLDAGGSARGAGMGWLAWVRVLSDLQGRRLPAWSRTQGVFAARSSDFQPPARNTIRSSFMINVLIVERASRW
jgi:hypothetical protein